MTIDDLIEELQCIRAVTGNVNVTVHDTLLGDDCPAPVCRVVVGADKGGNKTAELLRGRRQ